MIPASSCSFVTSFELRKVIKAKGLLRDVCRAGRFQPFSVEPQVTCLAAVYHPPGGRLAPACIAIALSKVYPSLEQKDLIC